MSDFYLQLDLDAIKRSTPLARAAGITQPEAIAGLIHMWEYCWYSKSDRVKVMHLAGFFAADPKRMAEALETFGFLAVDDDAAGWRVRGAVDRILRVKKAVSEGRSKGGKAAQSNLKQFQNKPPKAPAPKPTQQDLIEGDASEPEPKERAASEWVEAWGEMCDLAERHAEHEGIDYQREELPSKQINAMFKKAAERIEVSSSDLVTIWHEQWLENDWAKSRTPAFAVKAFLSEAILKKMHAGWQADAELLRGDAAAGAA